MTDDAGGTLMEDDPQLWLRLLFSLSSADGDFLRGDPLFLWGHDGAECRQLFARVPFRLHRDRRGDRRVEQFRPPDGEPGEQREAEGD